MPFASLKHPKMGRLRYIWNTLHKSRKQDDPQVNLYWNSLRRYLDEISVYGASAFSR